jgi:hypothetical protein
MNWRRCVSVLPRPSRRKAMTLFGRGRLLASSLREKLASPSKHRFLKACLCVVCDSTQRETSSTRRSIARGDIPTMLWTMGHDQWNFGTARSFRKPASAVHIPPCHRSRHRSRCPDHDVAQRRRQDTHEGARQDLCERLPFPLCRRPAIAPDTTRLPSTFAHEAGVFPGKKTPVRACPDQALANFAVEVIVPQMNDTARQGGFCTAVGADCGFG